MMMMILSVSLTVPYLGAERFGVWMTISSLASMLTFLDLGVGNALTNHVAKRAAEDNPVALRQAISGGLLFLLVIGTASGAVLFLISTKLPWAYLIKTNSTQLLSEAQKSGMVFALLFGLNLFTNGIQKVFSGLQRAFEGHLAATLSSAIAIAGVSIAAQKEAGMPALLAVTLGSQSTGALLLLTRLIKKDQFSLFESKNSFKNESKHLIQLGGLFFVLQIGTMIGWGADNLIISSTLGPAMVAVYSITQRLFLFISQPLGVINAPLWGAYADAHTRGEKTFIRTTLQNSMKLTFATSLGSALALCLASTWIIRHWTKGNIEVPLLLLAIYATWSVMDASANCFSMFMNGCNIIAPQIWGVLSLCTISIPLKIYLVQQHGLTAMTTGFTIFFSINLLLFYGLIFRKQILFNLH